MGRQGRWNFQAKDTGRACREELHTRPAASSPPACHFLPAFHYDITAQASVTVQVKLPQRAGRDLVGPTSRLTWPRPNLGKDRGFQVAVVAHHLPKDSQEVRERSLIDHKVGSL